MDYLTIVLVWAAVSSGTLAYDIFQGAFRLGKPCFPTHLTSQCNASLLQTYQSPIATTNEPTTGFFLFTNQSPDVAEALHECGGRLPPGSTFNPDHPTEIFIHGILDGLCRTAWMRETKEQIFQKGAYNVILVDWTWGNFPDVVIPAISNAKVVALQLAYVLNNIRKQTNTDCSKFHIVGHSYGAAMAGLVGKHLIDENCKLGRITGIDDFLVITLKESEDELLSPNDADFVDVIHVNDGKCFPEHFGDPRHFGHVDFLVNDGTHQYSCYPYAVESILKLDIFYGLGSLLWQGLCFHVQGVQYYKSSINANNDQLVGVQCDSFDNFKSGRCSRNCRTGTPDCLVMGMDTPLYYNASDKERRTYYVPTSLSCPYNDYSGFTGLPLKMTS